MRTIGILTHYQVHNHGAILQLHGLYHTLEKYGLAPRVLTYRKDFSFLDEKLTNKYSLSLKSIPFYLGYLKEQGVAKTFFNYRKHNLLSRFKQQHYRFASLQQEKLDFAVIGSDEVFSLEAGVNCVMYGHTVPADTVFSYAASFGQTDLNRIQEKYCTQLIASGLKNLKAVCVRDQASANTVKLLTGITPKICFDPVLLYGFKDELQHTQYTVPTTPYLVIYAYDGHLNSQEEIDSIRAFANSHHLQIVSAGFYHSWADVNLNVTPLELLKVVQHASYVVTDTFHGSVMSILLNRPFAVKVQSMNANKINYLLDSLGASSHKLTKFNELGTVLCQKNDWTKINQNIQNWRQEGLKYLQEILHEKK